MSDLSDFKRGQIVGTQLGGMSVRDSAKLCDVSSRTVIKVMSVYNNYGHIPPARRKQKLKGQTKKSTDEKKASGEGEGAAGNPLLDTEVSKQDENKKITEQSHTQQND